MTNLLKGGVDLAKKVFTAPGKAVTSLNNGLAAKRMQGVGATSATPPAPGRLERMTAAAARHPTAVNVAATGTAAGAGLTATGVAAFGGGKPADAAAPAQTGATTGNAGATAAGTGGNSGKTPPPPAEPGMWDKFKTWANEPGIGGMSKGTNLGVGVGAAGLLAYLLSQHTDDDE